MSNFQLAAPLPASFRMHYEASSHSKTTLEIGLGSQSAFRLYFLSLAIFASAPNLL